MERRIALSLLAVAISSCGGDTTPASIATPATSPGSAFSATIVGGALSGVVGTDLPITVRVADAKGTAVPNQIVNFVVTAGGGHVFAGSATSSAIGEAREVWTLGTRAIAQSLEIRAVGQKTGEPQVLASHSLVAAPGAPTTLTVPGASYQLFLGQHRSAASVASDVQATVADAFGNRIASAVFVVSASGALAMVADTVVATGTGHGSLTITSTGFSKTIPAEAIRDLRSSHWVLSYACAGSSPTDSLRYTATSSGVAYGSQSPPNINKQSVASVTLNGTLSTWSAGVLRSVQYFDSLTVFQTSDTLGLGGARFGPVQPGNFILADQSGVGTAYQAVALGAGYTASPCSSTFAVQGPLRFLSVP